MGSPKQKHIQILNPISGANYTTERKARQYVEDKRADYVRDKYGRQCLKFRDSDPRNLRVALNVNLRVTDYDIAASRGCASLESIRNTPFTGKPIRALILPTKRTTKPQ